jgi:Fur family ferric uptake transcriptional regulator
MDNNGEKTTKTSTYNTKIKKSIIAIFKDNINRCLSAKEIHAGLLLNGKKADVSTVYRNLDTLTESGIIIRFQDEKSEKALYRYAGEHGGCLSHLHMKCTSCGAIFHLDCQFMNLLEGHINAEHGFSISYTESIIYGICNSCKQEDI